MRKGLSEGSEKNTRRSITMGKLDGKVAVITGGTTGIGLATAKLFVSEGAHVFITGRRQKELDAAVKEVGRNITGVQGDVAKLDDLDRLYATVKAQKGRVDVLFANAGIGEMAPVGAITEEHFDKIFDVNARGTYFTVQKALPLFKNGGSIILTGSVVGSKGFSNFSVYAATKAAIRSFARSWTVDLKGRNIRVNVISPGPIDTPILGPLPKEVMDGIASSVPMGRIGKSDEIAKPALFLASDDSSFISGAELFVDGGLGQV
jgi:NAD(P)-dependent dehydrogenase (short-subunit alcohol dehydrogenase family)